MKQIVKIVRKVDIEKKYMEMLLAELDYELISLFDAMQREDKKDIEKSKNRLEEIRKELNEEGAC